MSEPEARRESLNAMVSKQKRELAERLEGATAAAAGANVIRFESLRWPEATLVLHRSARRPGWWQLTRFNLTTGVPAGHDEYASREAGLASAVGAGGWTSSGDASWRVAEVRGEAGRGGGE